VKTKPKRYKSEITVSNSEFGAITRLYIEPWSPDYKESPLFKSDASLAGNVMARVARSVMTQKKNA